MNKPYRVYECPCCNNDVKVEEDDKFIFCSNCGKELLICNDAEFVNGMWIDLTTLKLVQ